MPDGLAAHQAEPIPAQELPTCAKCKEQITDEPYHAQDGVGRPVELHVACWELHQRQKAEDRERRKREARERETARLQGRFIGCAGWGSGAMEWEPQYGSNKFEMADKQKATGMPRWDWARLDNPEFRKRANQKILSAIEGHDLKTGLVIFGRTGLGKTACLVARLHRMRDVALAAIAEGKDPPFTDFGWYFGIELVMARRNWALGEESPIVERAKDKCLLVIDELGFEPMSEIIFEVINARYSEGKPTIVTSGLTLRGFRDRYGDALFRRLTEAGGYVEGPAK